MRQLPNLTSLTITDLKIEDISDLAGLPRLTSLNLSNAKEITDITPIGRLLALRSLTITNAEKVKSIESLASLKSLTSLTLTGCIGFEDLAPLEKLADELRTLDLRNTTASNLKPLAYLVRLRTLDLRGHKQITEEDHAWLKTQLPETNIRK